MKCPGQDSRYWKPGAIFDVKCPNCGEMIEFFKDDTRRKCPRCGHEVPNPEMDFGCAAYCPYAEHCLGSMAGGKAGNSRLKILKGKMTKIIRNLFDNDSRKVAEATSFLELCEELGKKEGADLGLVLLAGFATLCIKKDAERMPREKAIGRAMERLLETGADETLAGDALSLVNDAVTHDIQDQQKLANHDIIRDATSVARFLADGRTDWQGLARVLLTDSARQMAADRAAIQES